MSELYGRVDISHRISERKNKHPILIQVQGALVCVHTITYSLVHRPSYDASLRRAYEVHDKVYQFAIGLFLGNDFEGLCCV